MTVADLQMLAGRTGRLVLMALVLVLASGPALADEGGDDQSWYESWNFSGSASLDYRYNAELFNAGEEHQYRSLLDLFANRGRWTIGLTLNGANFFPREPYREFNDFVQVDRFFIDYAGDHLYATVGDFYTSFERGLTLSVLRDPVIFRDNTIRGARTSLNYKHFEMDILGGYVEDKVTDEQDWIGGIRAAAILPRDIRIGVSAVYSDDKSDDWIEGEHQLGSVFVDMPGLFDKLDIYAEYAIKDSELEPTGEKGHGFYMSATFYQGSFTLLTEYKDYEKFNYEHNNPPSADRLDEFFAPDDTKGFRVKPSYYIDTWDSDIYVSYSRFENILNDSIVEHYFAGIEQHGLFDRIYVHTWAGRRSEVDGKDENKASLASTIDIGEDDSVVVDFLIKYAKDPFFCDTQIESSVGYSFSGRWIASVLYQYAEVQVWDKNHFWGGELTANITDSLQAKIFAGALKGGQVCSGGQCRYEDPFDGVKLNLVYRF